MSVTPIAICDSCAIASGAASRAVSTAWRESVGGGLAARVKPGCMSDRWKDGRASVRRRARKRQRAGRWSRRRSCAARPFALMKTERKTDQLIA